MKKVNAAPLSEQIQGAVALGQFQNPTESEHIRRLPSGQLLRAAAAEDALLGPRLGPPRPGSDPRSGAEDQQAAASPSGSIGGLHSPRAASAPARPRIKSTVAPA